MSQCACCNANADVSSINTSASHTNAFINLNGMPYLLGEYIDRETFQQIDPSVVESSISVDSTESMRAIIDVNINDINTTTGGAIQPMGNTTQISSLQNIIANKAAKLQSKLPVLRKGLVIRVYYRLENARTGIVLRSAIETLRIKERNLFLMINSGNINDNAIIANFSESMVSTLGEFTHGTVPMILRITSIQLAYEYVKVNPVIPKVTSSIVGYPVELLNSCDYPDPYAAHPCCNMSELDMYNYNKTMQCKHFIGDPVIGHPNNYVVPDSWYAFSRFYHFDEGGQTIILHENEIYDNATKCLEMQCGYIHVNRAFIVNPGHRIVWKFCIWKNDLIVVNDTTSICHILQAPCGCHQYPLTFSQDVTPLTNCPFNSGCNTCNPNQSEVDNAQNAQINSLLSALHAMQVKLAELTGDDSVIVDPELLPTDPVSCGCGDHSQQIANITSMMSALQEQIEVLEQKQAVDDAKPDVGTVTEEDITAAINAARTSTHVDLS